MDPLFEVHMLNDVGKEKARNIAEAYNSLLGTLKNHCPDSREFSVAKTKLEESCFFAKKSIANVPENQQDPAPAQEQATAS